MRPLLHSSVLIALCLACGARSGPDAPPRTAEPAAAARPPPRMREPEWLPPQAREMLTARMQRHGEQMILLLLSIVTLSHEDAAHLAGEVAAEPKLARPGPDQQDTLEAMLPPRFFVLQDELAARAGAVVAAAEARDEERLVRAYGQLTETCVSCHAVYLSPDRTLREFGD